MWFRQDASRHQFLRRYLVTEILRKQLWQPTSLSFIRVRRSCGQAQEEQMRAEFTKTLEKSPITWSGRMVCFIEYHKQLAIGRIQKLDKRLLNTLKRFV